MKAVGLVRDRLTWELAEVIGILQSPALSEASRWEHEQEKKRLMWRIKQLDNEANGGLNVA